MMKSFISLFLVFALVYGPILHAKGRIQGADMKNQLDLQTAYATITGNLSSSSACITSPSSTTGIYAGQYIYDLTTSGNIGSGVTVVALPGTCSAGQIQMSANASGTATGDSLGFGAPLSALTTDAQIWASAVTPAQPLSSAISSGAIGGTGGTKNYLTTYNSNTGNGDFEQGTTNGWSLGHVSALTNGLPTGTPTFGSGASGNLSIAAVTGGSQLSKVYSMNYVSSAATTVGDMVCSSAFTIDASDQAKVLGLSMNYKAASGAANMNFSGTSSNSYGLAVYDVTNSSFLSTVGAFNIVQSSGVGKATATVQTGATTASMRVCLYNVTATAGAATLTVDDFVIGPQVSVNAPAMGDWTTTTTTITATTTAPTKGTTSTDVFSYKRVGDSLEIYVDYIQTAAGSAGSGTYLFTLPNGLSIDTAKIPVGVPTNSGAFGTGGSTAGNGTNQLQYPLFVVPYDATHIAISYLNTIGNLIPVSSSAQNLAQTNVTYSFRAIVPIAGWSSNAVSSSDTDTRVVAASYSASSTISWTATGGGNFDTKNFDTHAAVTTGANSWRFTAPVSGVYRVTATIQISSSNQLFDLYKNGSIYKTLFTSVSATNQANTGSATVQLNAGDYIYVALDSGTANGVSNINANNIYIERISGPAVVQATESVNFRYYNASSPGSVTTTPTVIKYSTKAFDSHNAFNTSTGIYTVPVSGKYQFSAAVLAYDDTATDNIQFEIQKNGVTYSVQYLAIPLSTSANPFTFSITDIIPVNAGDTIAVYMHTGGHTLSFPGSNTAVYFSGARVGN